MNLPKTFTILMALCLTALPVLAGDSSSSSLTVAHKGISTEQGDKGLASKRVEFKQFAHSKINQLNRNLKICQSRMQITKQADGSWQALYHKIDDASMEVKVRRSQSKASPFVGILSYQEQVFKAISKTPNNFAPETFTMVKIIPNRHIFSYQKGTWN